MDIDIFRKKGTEAELILLWLLNPYFFKDRKHLWKEVQEAVGKLQKSVLFYSSSQNENWIFGKSFKGVVQRMGRVHMVYARTSEITKENDSTRALHYMAFILK